MRILLALALGVALTACGPAPASTSKEIVYEVSGAGTASTVSYSADGSGSLAQQTDVSLPWRHQIDTDRAFSIVSVSAQNGGSGEIRCRITADGALIKEAVSTGQYAVVTCTGST